MDAVPCCAEAMSSLNNAAKYLQLGHPDAYQLHDTLGHCRKIFNDLPGAINLSFLPAAPLLSETSFEICSLFAAA